MKFKNNFEGPLNGDALLTIGNHHATGFSSSSRFWFFRICIFDFIFKDSWVILFVNFINGLTVNKNYVIRIVVSLKEFITRLLASFKIKIVYVLDEILRHTNKFNWSAFQAFELNKIRFLDFTFKFHLAMHR